MSRNDFKPKKKKIQVNSLVQLYICNSSGNEVFDDEIIINFPDKLNRFYPKDEIENTIDAGVWMTKDDCFECETFIPVNKKINKELRKQKGTGDKLYDKEMKVIPFVIPVQSDLGKIIKLLINKKSMNAIKEKSGIKWKEIEINITYAMVKELTFHVKSILTDHTAFSNNVEKKVDLTNASYQGIYQAAAQQSHIFSILQDNTGNCFFAPLCLFRLVETHEES